jgi:hypothetical protein
MSTTEVPNAIFSIFAATKASVSMGSTTDQLETCHHWFRDTSHGGLIGQIIPSKTHRESNPAFSAPFARLIMFSFVA